MNAHVSEAKGAAVPAQAQTVAPPPPARRRSRRLLLMVSVPVLLAAVGGYFYLTGGRYEETDNAYVHQAKVSVSADVAGRITAVNVAENQLVHAGDVLFTLDPEPYRIALDQANAALGSARVGVEQLKAGYAAAQAGLEAAQSSLVLQQEAYDRQNALFERQVASAATLDQPKLALQQAQNAVASARQQVASAAAGLGGDPAIDTDAHPAVLAAQAQVDLAARNLAKTQVIAAADGVVSQIGSLNVGQFVATGTTIASLVATSTSWVEANFKETQLGAIRIGMPAEVEVDALPGEALHGTVTSIGAATGAEFALIPAQNATGNWVKVVQRIPVRIDFDGAEAPLRSGMSALVSVDTGASTLDKLQH